jgi:sterol 14-demethylase
MRAYIPIFVKEVEDYINSSPRFEGRSGICNITEVMAEITIYTASGSLQGKEVRSKFDTTFATLYRHLDDGFQPINFIAPWLPLPQNRRRDNAQQVMEELYSDIIRKRRKTGNLNAETDMIWTLMDAQYKDGTTIPDAHIARLMIALLMGGQHNTAASGAWLLLNLANKPHLIEEMYCEQLDVLGSPLPPLTWESLQKLTLSEKVIKETLRLHSPIHSIMRAVKTPMPVPDTNWIVPPGNTLIASPGVPARDEKFFPNPLDFDPHRWDKLDNPEKGGDDAPNVDYGFGMVSKAVSSPYLPFGAGRHRCVGEQYAYAQLGAIVATMVRLLKWEQVDPKAPIPATDYSVSFSSNSCRIEVLISTVYVLETDESCSHQVGTSHMRYILKNGAF